MSSERGGSDTQEPKPASGTGTDGGPPRSGATFLQTVRAVCWSFFGVRRRADLEADAARLNPVHVVIAGVGMALLFAAVLIEVVHLATS